MKVLACTSYNEATGTCEVQAWHETPTVLPPLSIPDATVIAGAIIGTWAVAFGLRTVARFIWRG